MAGWPRGTFDFREMAGITIDRRPRLRPNPALRSGPDADSHMVPVDNWNSVGTKLLQYT